jgi:hypothetical protein
MYLFSGAFLIVRPTLSNGFWKGKAAAAAFNLRRSVLKSTDGFQAASSTLFVLAIH